jgi:hypothetical protein
MSADPDQSVDLDSRKDNNHLFQRIRSLFNSMLAKHNLEKGFRVEIEKIMKGLL